MDALLKEVCDSEALMAAETKYKKEKALGSVSNATEFEYCMCLIRSKYKQDWEHGLRILVRLSKTKDAQKRDYIYFIAFTQCKLENYDEAIRCCKAFLMVEPQNRQIHNLMGYAEKAKKKQALTGAAIVGGAGFALGLGLAAGAVLIAKVARK